MLRRIALLTCCLAALAAAPAAADPVGDACAGASPSAAPCLGYGKLTGAATTPLTASQRAAAVAAYHDSWVHRAARLQARLGDELPLGDAQWIGTHNSFNSVANGPTASHVDSNQQLTLAQQLDVDVRSIELDLHYVPNLGAGGPAVVVCHGRGPSEQHFGCTTEDRFADVLPEVAGWLDAHRDAVVLLYLEDELGADAGYAETVSTLESVLRRDGRSLIYRPTAVPSGGCAQLPLATSRDDVRAAGAQVVLVGNCRAGWSSAVFGWDAVHVESGSTSGFRAFPACDATYGADVYAAKLVRYFEDSTFVSAAVDPAQSPAGAQAGRLTPERVAAMTRCGVNLLGLDQLEPGDGRLEASIWSWAPGGPDPRAGRCATQRPADGRWVTAPCGAPRRAACRTSDGAWAPSPAAVPFGAATHACPGGSRFAVPRSGDDNERLRVAAGGAPVWVAHRLTQAD